MSPNARAPVAGTELGAALGALVAQVAWFNRLRLFAVIGAVAMTLLGHAVLGLVDRPAPLYVLCGLLLGVDAIYFAWFARLAKLSMLALRRHVDLQIAIDLLILTALLHYSGGVGNPFVLFYLFHTFIASLLLSVRAALWVAVASMACVAGLGVGELFGWFPTHPTRLMLIDLTRVGALGLTAWLLAFGMTLACSIYFVATVLRRLRRREDEVTSLGRQLAQGEKLASIGTLAAGVSHEINNPVAVIQSKVQVLRYRIDDGDKKEALHKELETIEKHARRIGQITNGLLTFSKETPFQLAPLEINTILEEVADLVRVPFHEASLALRLTLDPASPRVLGSANHLLQVLVNILLNARDASPPGSEVRLASEVGGGTVTLSVSDQGTGIRPEHLAKIFDPFFTTKDVDKGTGLGLAISHGIVHKHGGTIEVASEPGRGATFRVRLPRLDATSRNT